MKLGCTYNQADTQIAMFMGSKWDPSGSCRPQMGPMLAPWILLSGYIICDCARGRPILTICATFRWFYFEEDEIDRDAKLHDYQTFVSISTVLYVTALIVNSSRYKYSTQCFQRFFSFQIKKCEVEKRRRERIEVSLEHMKTLVLNAYGKNVSILTQFFLILC